MKILTVASDPNRANILIDGCRRFGVEPVVLGVGQPYPNNVIKLHYVREAIRGLDEPIVFLDAYDVEVVKDPKAMVIPNYVVFAAERYCYPDWNREADYPAPPFDTPYKFLNSGCYCGPSQLLSHLLDPLELQGHSDQGIITQAFFAHPGRIRLDYEQQYFHCRNGARILEVPDTFFVHYNGGSWSAPYAHVRS
ncbi:glycosyltransferase domain-containing protein [Limnoglobus roseus]|uniref:PLOD1-3-like GT domain-containing protein n=1 Tax=Limnoglobus roseus TaxID=2598579 RepID=A0A5C1APX6_9BACT|nr:glycosyltransferase domain-containing protein [Limnoglobus roseus]QEL18918.1 hypothetical protein PX52LOC_05968 [Limnoglobus roseus]